MRNAKRKKEKKKEIQIREVNKMTNSDTATGILNEEISAKGVLGRRSLITETREACREWRPKTIYNRVQGSSYRGNMGKKNRATYVGTKRAPPDVGSPKGNSFDGI